MYDYMDSVANLMRQKLRYDTDDIRARHSLATALFEQNNTQEALREYWKVLDVQRNYASGEALFASALCLAQLKQHEDALIYLHEAKAVQNFDSERYAIAASRSMIALHQFENAEKLLRETIENSEGKRRNSISVARLWVELGTVLYANGVIDASDAAFYKASTYAPKNAEINGRRALFYLDQNSLTEAKIPLEKAIYIDPNEAYTTIARAEYFLKVGNRETAFAFLENISSDAFRILKQRKALYELYEYGAKEFEII